jgi:hypothetical protein
MPSEIRRLGVYHVMRSRHLSSVNFVYDVWEALAGTSLEDTGHSTVRIVQEGKEFRTYGRLGTRALPPDIRALPMGKARAVAVDRFTRAQARLAYRIIGKAFPHVLTLIARNCARQENAGVIVTTEVAG